MNINTCEFCGITTATLDPDVSLAPANRDQCEEWHGGAGEALLTPSLVPARHRR
jgi:hypothetical protein